jgi:hypothetical protein
MFFVIGRDFVHLGHGFIRPDIFDSQVQFQRIGRVMQKEQRDRPERKKKEKHRRPRMTAECHNKENEKTQENSSRNHKITFPRGFNGFVILRTGYQDVKRCLS